MKSLQKNTPVFDFTKNNYRICSNFIQERYDLTNDEKWSKILDLQVGDTVWYYRSSKAASVAAKSRLNGNYGHVHNSSIEKDVGFVRYVGPITNETQRCGYWIGVELFLEPNKGQYNGRLGSVTYFEAPEYSSVFTKVNHLYFYDEDEDIEQIRQKIDSHVASVNDLVQAPSRSSRSKKTVWKKFEMDRKSNADSHQRVFGGSQNYGKKLFLRFLTNMTSFCNSHTF